MRRLFALFALLLTTWISTAEADEFTKSIRPILKSHCQGCHSSDEKKGGLDLARFSSLKTVRQDIEPWQAVAHMLRTKQMPPPGSRQLSAKQHRLISRWLARLLEDEAQQRAGDPGPRLLRRLNNTEYRNSIRVLAGLDLNTGRNLPVDGAAGEGFLNASDALAISSERIAKYLAAAKETANHIVLLPKGFRFSKSKFREDWVNEIISEIHGIHRRYGNELGGIPLQPYVKALFQLRHHAKVNSAAIAEEAKRYKLSSKYLGKLWQTLNDRTPTTLVGNLKTRWNKAKGTDADVKRIADHIYALQAIFWHKQVPNGSLALQDRFVKAPLSIATKQTLRIGFPKPPNTVAVYIASRNLAGGQPAILLGQPRLEGKNKKTIFLRDALKQGSGLSATRFGPRKKFLQVDPKSLVMVGSQLLTIKLPRALVAGRTFVVDVQLISGPKRQSLVHLEVRRTAKPAFVDRGLKWQFQSAGRAPTLLARSVNAGTKALLQRAARDFCDRFPARLCYPGLIVRDTVVTLERFHRGDSYLSQLFLRKQEQQRLDHLWHELHYVSRDAIQVRNSIATLTQGEMRGYDSVKKEIDRRATATTKELVTSQPSHLKSLLELAQQAYRRPLSASERQSLLNLYKTLRAKKLSHDVSLRSVVARLLVSPHFLFRVETPPDGDAAQPIGAYELANRLSYFLWSSPPDRELLRHAATGDLQKRLVLKQQVQRMLRDRRVRALAREFGAQWLEVRKFADFRGKDEKRFPTFNAKLRRAMDEEATLFFTDLFRNDRSFRDLLSGDRAFLNETLARHYGIPKVRGDQFREVSQVSKYNRGGILGLGSVLAKHSGASRTSPVLRGNWISETLLGEKLPRPPEGVPELPESETAAKLTIRQLVEQHAKVKQCAICHKRIDPLGFALEGFDTIGRARTKDAAGRPVDNKAELSDGVRFQGITGLRKYLLTDRREDFARQFSKKLLGYAVGRRVLLSDTLLLRKLTKQSLAENSKISTIVHEIVNSRQFRFIRGRRRE